MWTLLNDFLLRICWIYAALKWNLMETPAQACDALARVKTIARLALAHGVR
jgi:hypothetical protein